MRTLLALVVAAAMIAGALVVRGNRGGDLGPLAPDDPLQVVCASELAAACERLGEDVDVRVEPAGETAARLSTMPAAAEAPHGWVTLAPWPQIVAENRQRAGLEPLSGDEVTPLGRSPLVLAGWDDRIAALTDSCGGNLLWPCLGEHAGQPWPDLGGQRAWGRVEPGHDDPSSTATGLLVVAEAVSQFLGTTDFSARDLAEDELLAWLTRLEQGVPRFGRAGNTAMQQMVQLGRSHFDAVGSLEAEVGPLIARSAGRADGIVVVYPEPLVVATAVLAPLRAGAQGRLADEVAEVLPAALAQSGWRVEGQPNVTGVLADPPLPAEDNLPPAGVLEALRLRTEEISR